MPTSPTSRAFTSPASIAASLAALCNDISLAETRLAEAQNAYNKARSIATAFSCLEQGFRNAECALTGLPHEVLISVLSEFFLSARAELDTGLVVYTLADEPQPSGEPQPSIE